MEEENKKDRIEEARELAERIEVANKKAEELLRKTEETIAKNILGGRTDAGTKAPEPIDPEVAKKNRVNEMLKKVGFKQI